LAQNHLWLDSSDAVTRPRGAQMLRAGDGAQIVPRNRYTRLRPEADGGAFISEAFCDSSDFRG
jgi:hypothetical protein